MQEGAPQAGGGVPDLQLQGLQLRLGPELRAQYPVVVNMGISGSLELNGPLNPKKLRLAGVVNLESGEVRSCSKNPPVGLACAMHGS